MSCSLDHAHHRRSKSSSDRNLGVPRRGVSKTALGNPHESHELLPSRMFSGMQSPLDERSNNRASLEKDIEQLQLRLQEEKSMRMVLEKAMGRASSTLSPGHRHFAAQTKELLSEIELLEEEVANREQHVLSLYRSIFEHCVSRAPSEQSSSLTSPAHAKNGARKHPSIISSAFCSSKKFTLRPLQALVSVNDSKKRTLSSKVNGQTSNLGFEEPCLDTIKANEMLPTMEKASVIRMLKDHLYQCPSKLSEEMVRCMAAVYFWLRSAASVKSEKDRSPLLSRSSTNVILPRRGTVEDHRDWSGKSQVEISWISTNKNQFSYASYAINNYRVLVEQLEKVHVSQMESNAQIAFWINVYNSLLMHAYLAYGIPHRSLKRLALFHKAAYNIGGHFVSANAIEQFIFGLRTPRIGRWLETIFSTALRKKVGEERQLINSRFGLPNPQPQVCFALCTGAISDPVLKVYTAENVENELEVAKKEFLQANISVKKSRKVFLPKLLERFGRESSISSDDLLKWLIENVDKRLRDLILKCIDHKVNKKASHVIEWLPYNPRFRYVFSKDLTEKA